MSIIYTHQQSDLVMRMSLTYDNILVEKGTRLWNNIVQLDSVSVIRPHMKKSCVVCVRSPVSCVEMDERITVM